MHFKGLPPEWMPLSDHFMNHKSLFFIARKNVLLPAMSKNPRCLRLYGRRQRDSARGRGLTQEKLTPFLLLARIPSLFLPLLRPVQLDEAKERQNKRPQNVQLRPTDGPAAADRHGLLDGE